MSAVARTSFQAAPVRDGQYVRVFTGKRRSVRYKFATVKLCPLLGDFLKDYQALPFQGEFLKRGVIYLPLEEFSTKIIRYYFLALKVIHSKSADRGYFSKSCLKIEAMRWEESPDPEQDYNTYLLSLYNTMKEQCDDLIVYSKLKSCCSVHAVVEKVFCQLTTKELCKFYELSDKVGDLSLMNAIEVALVKRMNRTKPMEELSAWFNQGSWQTMARKLVVFYYYEKICSTGPKAPNFLFVGFNNLYRNLMVRLLSTDQRADHRSDIFRKIISDIAQFVLRPHQVKKLLSSPAPNVQNTGQSALMWQFLRVQSKIVDLIYGKCSRESFLEAERRSVQLIEAIPCKNQSLLATAIKVLETAKVASSSPDRFTLFFGVTWLIALKAASRQQDFKALFEILQKEVSSESYFVIEQCVYSYLIMRAVLQGKSREALEYLDLLLKKEEWDQAFYFFKEGDDCNKHQSATENHLIAFPNAPCLGEEVCFHRVPKADLFEFIKQQVETVMIADITMLCFCNTFSILTRRI